MPKAVVHYFMKLYDLFYVIRQVAVYNDRIATAVPVDKTFNAVVICTEIHLLAPDIVVFAHIVRTCAMEKSPESMGIGLYLS